MLRNGPQLKRFSGGEGWMVAHRAGAGSSQPRGRMFPSGSLRNVAFRTGIQTRLP